MKKMIFLFMLCLLLSDLTACAAKRNGFTNSVSSGQIQRGMTKEEVRAIVGPPFATSIKKVSETEVKEVWKYMEQVTLWKSIIVYVDFTNDKLTGWETPVKGKKSDFE